MWFVSRGDASGVNNSWPCADGTLTLALPPCEPWDDSFLLPSKNREGGCCISHDNGVFSSVFVVAVLVPSGAANFAIGVHRFMFTPPAP